MLWLQIIVFSLSVSIDALGIGISYGIQSMKIDKWAVAAVGCISAGMMGAAVLAGSGLAEIFPKRTVTICGALIMLMLGLWFLLQSLKPKGEDKYDKDNSRHIDLREGIVLGAAMSIDILSAGITAAAAGLANPLLILTVGLMQSAFLYTGASLLTKITILNHLNKRTCTIVSGITLIGLAIAKLIT